MEQTIDIDKENYIVYDTTIRSCFMRNKIEDEKFLKDYRERLNNMPALPTDEELLNWAKSNYPIINRNVEKEYLEKEISSIIRYKKVV